MRQYSKKLLISAGIVAVLTFLVYLPALKNGFVNWDDQVYIYKNPNITSFDIVFLKWAFFKFYFSNWHPLTWISHALDYAVWGLNPLGHHLSSILLHGLNTFLVVIIIMRMLEFVGTERLSENLKLGIAIIAGMLFGLHPVHVESVAWVSERKDVLYAFFLLLSILSYSKHCRIQTDSARQLFLNKYYVASVGFFLLALMSKPMAVTLPVLLLVLDWYPFNRMGTRDKLKKVFVEKIPFFALTAASIIITPMAQTKTVMSLEKLSILARILVASHSLISYLVKMFWPHDLIPLYPYPRAATVASYEYFLSPFIVLIITAICFFLRKNSKAWLAAWLFYVISLLPVLGIVQVGVQAMADRYTYLPSLGPFLLIGVCLVSFYQKTAAALQESIVVKGIFIFFSFTMMILLSILTIHQIHIWKNGISLWSAEIESRLRKNPEDFQHPAMVFYDRGVAFETAGRFKEALDDYSKAIELQPGDWRLWEKRGLMNAILGKFKEALIDQDQAILLKPETAALFFNRGNLNVQIKKYPDAIRDYTRAIELSEHVRAEYYNNRGLTYERIGMLRESEKDLLKAEELKKWTEFKWSHLDKIICSAPMGCNSIKYMLNVSL